MGDTITCPTNAAPGAAVHVTGTASSCDVARSVIHNGNALAFAWLCIDGGFSVKFTAPACVQPPGINVVTVTVGTASCDVPIAPCG